MFSCEILKPSKPAYPVKTKGWVFLGQFSFYSTALHLMPGVIYSGYVNLFVWAMRPSHPCILWCRTAKNTCAVAIVMYHCYKSQFCHQGNCLYPTPAHPHAYNTDTTQTNQLTHAKQMQKDKKTTKKQSKSGEEMSQYTGDGVFIIKTIWTALSLCRTGAKHIFLNLFCSRQQMSRACLVIFRFEKRKW